MHPWASSHIQSASGEVGFFIFFFGFQKLPVSSTGMVLCYYIIIYYIHHYISPPEDLFDFIF